MIQPDIFITLFSHTLSLSTSCNVRDGFTPVKCHGQNYAKNNSSSMAFSPQVNYTNSATAAASEFSADADVPILTCIYF
jgi:hypothetical protein